MCKVCEVPYSRRVASHPVPSPRLFPRPVPRPFPRPIPRPVPSRPSPQAAWDRIETLVAPDKWKYLNMERKSLFNDIRKETVLVRRREGDIVTERRIATAHPLQGPHTH